MCADVYQQTVVKQPGQLNGEDFVIENCKVQNIHIILYFHEIIGSKDIFTGHYSSCYY